MITPSPMWGLIQFSLLVILCLFSVPIAASLGVIALLFAWLYYGNMASLAFTGLVAWGASYSYAMSMIPLFVMMGSIIAVAGLGSDAFECFYKWLSKLRGSLAIVSTVTCAAFGSITGSTAAAIATVGGIACPHMKRRGYSIELRLGTIASAGSLAHLIPPSLAAIIYCIIANVSVGKVFIAGLIPGIILTILFSLTVYIWVSLRPSAAPVSAESFPLKDKIISLKGPAPILIIFIAMIGGIYMGYFSPTEAAGIGIVYAIALTLIMRRLTWQGFKSAMAETLRITAFIMFLIIGARVFGATIAITQFPQYVGEVVTGFGLSPYALMFTIIGIFIVMGCVLDGMTLLILFVPLFYPAVTGLGFDPVWYGTLSVMMVEIAAVTPPVAAYIYIAQSLDPEATTMDVIRGVVPFYSCSIILVVLLVFFPVIAMWLPSMMY